MNIDNSQTMSRHPRPSPLESESAAPPLGSNSVDHSPVSMGQLELGAYRNRWRAALRFRLWAEVVEADKRDRALLHSEEVALNPPKPPLPTGWKQLKQQRYDSDRFRHSEDDEGDEDVTSSGNDRAEARSVSAGYVAASLIFARMIDSCPGLSNPRQCRSCCRRRCCGQPGARKGRAHLARHSFRQERLAG